VLAGALPNGGPWLQAVTVAGGKAAAGPKQPVAGLQGAQVAGEPLPVAAVATATGVTDAPSADEAGIRRAARAGACVQGRGCRAAPPACVGRPAAAAGAGAALRQPPTSGLRRAARRAAAAQRRRATAVHVGAGSRQQELARRPRVRRTRRALLVGGDAALALAAPDAPPGGGGGPARALRFKAAWAREEALGAAGPPLFLDLPAPSAARLAARRAAAPRLGERLHAEWLAVKARARARGPGRAGSGSGSHLCAAPDGA